MQTRKLLRRRFPTVYPMILILLWLVVLRALVLGIGMLFVR